MVDAVPVRAADGFISTQQFLPPGAKIFQYALADVPGVVAANNFFSWFNPVASGKTMAPLGLIVDSHANSAVNSGASLVLQRISAASAGTLVTPSTLTKFDPAQIDSVAEVRNTNPTVTRTGLTLLGLGPILTPSGGGNAPTFVSPFGSFPIVPAGTGVVFGTASGNTAQQWNFQLTWIEY